jgi:hypothetical protein
VDADLRRHDELKRPHPSQTLTLFLIVRCCWRRRGLLRRFFPTGTTDRTAQESRLLLLLGRRCRRRCRLRWWLRPLRCRCGLGLRAFRPEAAAITELSIGPVRTLIPLATTETAFALLVVTAIAIRTAIVAITVFARSVPIIPVAPEILAIATITTVEPLSVAAIMAIVVVPVVAILPLRTIVVAVLMIVIARLLLERLLRRITGRPLRLNAEFVAVLVAELVAVTAVGTAERVRASCAVIADRIDTALLRHLFAIAQDDAIIMFGVLKIIFRQHRIAGR